MSIIDRDRSMLLAIDFQQRLMPAIDGSETVVANARRLLDAAALFDVPILYTEQNAKGLGGTVAALAPPADADLVAHKLHFDACLAPGCLDRIPEGRDIVVMGCEAHVCVLQTVLGLRAQGRTVFVVADATGSRRPENRTAGLHRMECHGAELVTTEMVVFEWLQDSTHPRFKEAVALIR